MHGPPPPGAASRRPPPPAAPWAARTARGHEAASGGPKISSHAHSSRRCASRTDKARSPTCCACRRSARPAQHVLRALTTSDRAAGPCDPSACRGPKCTRKLLAGRRLDVFDDKSLPGLQPAATGSTSRGTASAGDVVKRSIVWWNSQASPTSNSTFWPRGSWPPPGQLDPPRVEVNAPDVKFRRNRRRNRAKTGQTRSRCRPTAHRTGAGYSASIRRRKLKQRIRLYKRTEGSSYAEVMPPSHCVSPGVTLPVYKGRLLDNRRRLGDMSTRQAPRRLVPFGPEPVSLGIAARRHAAEPGAARLYEECWKQPVRRAEGDQPDRPGRNLQPAAARGHGDLHLGDRAGPWRPLGQAAFALVVAAAMTAIVLLPLVVRSPVACGRALDGPGRGPARPRGPISVSPQFAASSPSFGRRRSCCRFVLFSLLAGR